ncbi:hypothetical protein RIF29_42037 [Crotalaria pallida]|uniref:Uncharacterized protein n=1 Tax=Crotalaria pallida TaxID=3830 RepID=A0AAN9E6S0_CROPI
MTDFLHGDELKDIKKYIQVEVTDAEEALREYLFVEHTLPITDVLSNCRLSDPAANRRRYPPVKDEETASRHPSGPVANRRLYRPAANHHQPYFPAANRHPSRQHDEDAASGRPYAPAANRRLYRPVANRHYPYRPGANRRPSSQEEGEAPLARAHLLLERQC